MAFRGLYEHSLDSKDRLTVPARFRAALADGVVLSKGFDPCVWLHTTDEFEALSERFLSPAQPFGRDARQPAPPLPRRLLRREARLRRADPHPQAADRARRARRPLRRDRRRRVPGDLERRRLGQAGGGARRRRPRRSPRAWPEAANDRSRHSYLDADRARTRPRRRAVELLAPEPGETAVDCTFGGGGHARLIAERLGPDGTLIGIDRDPAARGALRRARRRGALPRRASSRADYAEGLRALRGEGIRADMVYLDLGMSSMQLDAWERGFSYSYDAPLDMRMDPEPGVLAPPTSSTSGRESRIAQVLRRFGEERYAGRIAREIVRRRPLDPTSELVAAVEGRDAAVGPLRRRPPGQAHLPGDPDRRQRRARLARRGAAAGLGAAAARAAAWPRSPSTRSRTAA